MSWRSGGFSVRIVDDRTVEYRSGLTVVRLTGSFRDHVLYVDRPVVSGPPLPEDVLQSALDQIYRYVNEKRQMKVDFLRSDGTAWGRPQNWKATPLTDQERAALGRHDERRAATVATIRRWLRKVLGG